MKKEKSEKVEKKIRFLLGFDPERIGQTSLSTVTAKGERG